MRVGACPPTSAVQADQEARRAAEMVFAILGERVDHVEGPVERWSREGYVAGRLAGDTPIGRPHSVGRRARSVGWGGG
ncbi:hypothetical protein GCM10018775_21240 [Streptomyces umbrinus]|nr:hypothetical protein GCM10018775_21240 [Streptomyces umbrinus]